MVDRLRPLCDLGRVADAKELLLRVFDALDPLLGERETLRSLAAAAAVLAFDGQHELATVAPGGALGVQDQFVDYLGITRGRLGAASGTARTFELESEGAELPLDRLLARVRSDLSSA